ncbi:4856_t:CDS:2, partial [Ambispora leptoticha]
MKIFPPLKLYHEYYKPHEDFPRNPPPIIPISPTDSTKTNDENDEDQWILKDRYSENRTESWTILKKRITTINTKQIITLKQKVHPENISEHESLYGDQDHREEIITTHKRTRSYDSQISEEITSEDEKEMDEVEQEIENEGLNRPIRYQQQQGVYYDPQDQNEAGSSTNYTLYESDYTKTLKSTWRGQDVYYPIPRHTNFDENHWKKVFKFTNPEIAWRNNTRIEKGLKDIYETSTIGDKTPPLPSLKKEGIGVPDDISEMTDNDQNNFNFYKEIKEKYPIEMRHIILPTINEGKNVKYQILSDENTDIPPMFM